MYPQSLINPPAPEWIFVWNAQIFMEEHIFNTEWLRGKRENSFPIKY